jgi:GNAT superfamily N-acetyltransferase
MNNMEFVSFKTLSRSELNSISRSIISLDPEFYGAISKSKDEIVQVVSKIVLLSNSDCGSGEGLRVDGNLVGYVSYFPISERRMRGLVALKCIMDNLKLKNRDVAKDFLISAQQFQAMLQPFSSYTEGFYLNKIAVFPSFRGYGRYLFEHYLQKSSEKKLTPIFHCRFDNQEALHFYQKMNFVASSSDYKYRLMTEVF